MCGCCLRTQQCVLFVIVPNFFWLRLSHPCRGGRVFWNSQFLVCFAWIVLFVELKGFYGEFDPGAGRTLAACLTHASRTVRPLRGYTSGERVSNTWVICPALRDKPGKLGLIPDMSSCRMVGVGKFFGAGCARGLSACWWGNGLPRRRRVAGLRG